MVRRSEATSVGLFWPHLSAKDRRILREGSTFRILLPPAASQQRTVPAGLGREAGPPKAADRHRRRAALLLGSARHATPSASGKRRLVRAHVETGPSLPRYRLAEVCHSRLEKKPIWCSPLPAFAFGAHDHAQLMQPQRIEA